MYAKSILALVALLFSTAVVPGQIIMPGTDLDHQNLALTPMFNSVVWIGAYNQNPNLGGTGSGEVIRNDQNGVVVLTAGHVTTLSNQSGFTGFKVTSRPNIFNPTSPVINAAAWGTNPGYGGSFGQGADIGYVILPAGSTPGVTPATLSTTPMTVGNHAWLAGYGDLDIYGSGPQPYDGIKRAGENTIDQLLVAGYDHTSFPGSLTLQMNPTSGSSGGGMFLDNGDLGAIFSWGATDYSSMYSLDIAPYVSWANSIAVPEPGSLAFLCGPVALGVLSALHSKTVRRVTIDPKLAIGDAKELASGRRSGGGF